MRWGNMRQANEMIEDRTSVTRSLDPDDLTWATSGQRRQRSGYQQNEVRQRVTTCDEYNDAQTSSREILLMLEVAVRGNECFKTRGHGLPQQLTVLQTGPTLLLYGANIMIGEPFRESAGKLLIEKNAHQPSGPHEQPRARR